MSHAACNFYIIAALCKLNKDDFDSKIIMKMAAMLSGWFGRISEENVSDV